jgi:hypothetical protein
LEIAEEIIQDIEIVYPIQESVAIFLDLMSRYQPRGLKVYDFEIISIGMASGLHEVAMFNTKDFKSVKERSLLEVQARWFTYIWPPISSGNRSPWQENESARPEAVGTGTTPALPISALCQWRCTAGSIQSRFCHAPAWYQIYIEAQYFNR